MSDHDNAQDQDTVEDRWGRLLDLIIDYGAERFYVGYQYSQQRSTVKTMASGQPDSGTLLLLVRELEKLRREAGDD